MEASVCSTSNVHIVATSSVIRFIRLFKKVLKITTIVLLEPTQRQSFDGYFYRLYIVYSLFKYYFPCFFPASKLQGHPVL